MKPKQIKLIKSLYKSAEYEQKEKIKECFPEVFGLPKTGWVKDEYGAIVYRTGKASGYGVSGNIWIDNDGWWFGCFPKEWEPATESEVKEMLIEEAKRRGVWDCPIKTPFGNISEVPINENCFIIEENRLYSEYVLVFDNGKWATKLEEPKTETIHLFRNTYKISLVN
jgi:hypothetical protein